MHSVIRVPHHPPPPRTPRQGYTERELSGNYLVIKVQEQTGGMLSANRTRSNMCKARPSETEASLNADEIEFSVRHPKRHNQHNEI